MQVSSRSFEMKLIGPARCAAQLSIFFASIIFPSLSRSQAPIFEISPIESWINFHVKSSVKIAGKFDKWDATLTFTSPDETTAVLEIKIQGAPVAPGSGMKNRQQKRRSCFDVDHNT